jgi:MFS family permease
MVGGTLGCILSLIAKYVPPVHSASGEAGALIALIMGAVFGIAADRYGRAAIGAAVVGGSSALIGILLAFLLKDQPAQMLAFGTLGGVVAGTVGGLSAHAFAKRKAR